MHGLQYLPHSDYLFKFLDNLFLKIPIQWLVTFLEFFDQISETFGMSTVDQIVVFSRKYTLIMNKIFAALTIILSRAKDRDQCVHFHVLNGFIKYVLDSNDQITCSCNLKLICSNLTIICSIKTSKNLK